MTEQEIEFLIERLVQRINQANIFFLRKIGSAVRQLRELTPTQAHQLAQILKYGGSYEDILEQLSKYTNLDIKDIDSIFNEYAKKDYAFYEKFYQYRDIPYIPYKENEVLRKQTEALARVMKTEMYDYFRTNVLGYTIRNVNGRPVFRGLKEVYNSVIDEAVLNVGQGKDTFDSAIRRILKDIGGSGLKTVDYKSGRSVRLDSTLRMHLKSKLREVHNENQRIIGEEIGADGVEITVHENPAVDHAPIQGLQFSNEEYAKLQNGQLAKEYNSENRYTLDHDNKNGYRPISEMNCYHVSFSIVLGVSKPLHSKEELKAIQERNEKGFEYEGKHYTMYEGTQLQRSIEREIRKQKDIQILAKASGDDELVLQAQQKITQLTNKYKKLSDVSGLPTKIQRLQVSGYKKVSEKTLNINRVGDNLYNTTDEFIKNATPNSHKVVIDKEFIDNNGLIHPIEGKETAILTPKDSDEYRRSEWIEEKFGGEIHNVPRITTINTGEKSINTPDFIWNGEKWDLKTPNPEKKETNIIEAFTKKKKTKLQAQSFIVDIQNTELSQKEVYNFTKETMQQRNWIENVMVVKKDKLLFVISKK